MQSRCGSHIGLTNCNGEAKHRILYSTMEIIGIAAGIGDLQWLLRANYWPATMTRIAFVTLDAWD